jgi:hypothetical protein
MERSAAAEADSRREGIRSARTRASMAREDAQLPAGGAEEVTEGGNPEVRVGIWGRAAARRR